MNKMIFSTASLWLALAATSGTAIADAQSAEGALTLDAAAVKAEGIVTAPAAVRRLQGEIKAPGEVKANGYATVLVSPRVPAQVVKAAGAAWRQREGWRAVGNAIQRGSGRSAGCTDCWRA